MRVATLYTIPIRVHWSCGAVFLAWLLWAIPQPAQLWGHLVLAGVLFVSVLLHELGHAFAARTFGITTQEVVLFPLGGMTIMETATVRPFAELMIAAGGPLVNIVLALTLGVVAWVTQAQLIWLAAALNVALGVLNLIPAYPMDGGRVLRAVLAEAFGAARAQRWSLLTGRVFAGSLLVTGAVLQSPALAILGAVLAFILWREVLRPRM